MWTGQNNPALGNFVGFGGGNVARFRNAVRALTPAAWYRYGVGITVTGQGVSTWADQSGNARDLLQGTDGARPALQADNSILFNGTDEFLATGAFALAQPNTVYLLFRQVTWTMNDEIFSSRTTTSRVNQTPTTPTLRMNAGTGSPDNAGLAVNTYGALACVFNGASSLSQVNNNAPATGNSGTNAFDGFTIGASANGVANWSNIQVKEVILFAAAHNAATRSLVIRYLQLVGGI